MDGGDDAAYESGQCHLAQHSGRAFGRERRGTRVTGAVSTSFGGLTRDWYI